MQFTPHDYQYAFELDYLRWVEGDSDNHPFRLYTSPTGTGKSVMELMALAKDPHAFLITNRLEIVSGMLHKMGVNTDGWSNDRLAWEALARRISTPVRLRNMLAKGVLQARYKEACLDCLKEYSGPIAIHRILLDEGHHILADTYKDLAAYLPHAWWAVLTATGFRGTAKETEEFHELFNNQVIQVLSLRQAAERNLFSVPTPRLWALINDDTLEVVNGEIRVASATQAVGNVINDIVIRVGSFYIGDDWGNFGWDMPTMFAVPSRQSAYELAGALDDAGLPADCITESTARGDRADIFRRTVNREICLVQIDVVSEGVDLPIRRLIDLRPTLSPVKWMQQLGRITRPFNCRACSPFGPRPHGVSPTTGDAYAVESCLSCGGTGFGRSEYICTNRNLERHGYLLEGLLPPSVMKAAQELFPTPYKRAGMRVVGLDGVGRFEGTVLPLAGGLRGLMYNITTMDGYQKKEYVVLCHPCCSVPIIALKESTSESGEMKYGKFQRVDKLPDLSGYGSAKPAKLSPRQSAWWGRDAQRFGLDQTATVNRKQFPALPVLKDLGLQLISG